jgi:hypothetical protein
VQLIDDFVVITGIEVVQGHMPTTTSRSKGTDVNLWSIPERSRIGNLPVLSESAQDERTFARQVLTEIKVRRGSFVEFSVANRRGSDFAYLGHPFDKISEIFYRGPFTSCSSSLCWTRRAVARLRRRVPRADPSNEIPDGVAFCHLMSQILPGTS